MAYDRIVVIPVSDSFSLVVVSIKSFEQTKSIAQFWEGFGGNIKKVLSSSGRVSSEVSPATQQGTKHNLFLPFVLIEHSTCHSTILSHI